MNCESILGNISSEEHKLVLEMMLNTQYEYSLHDNTRPIEISIEQCDE